MSLHSFEGASGEHYDYVALNLKNREAFPMGGGNYLFTRPSEKGEVIVCAGDSANLWTDFVMRWDIAKRKYGATVAYLRVNHDQKARRTEREDLVAKHHPAMNVDALGKAAS